MNMKYQIVIPGPKIAMAVILAMFFSGMCSCKDRHSPPVKTVKVFRGSVSLDVSANGTVKPQNRLEIKPSINGRIEEILMREGDKVRKGQILAWMSNTERAALIDAARAGRADDLDYWKKVYLPTPIISPIAGEVIVRAVEPGQTISMNTPIMVLSDRLIVKAFVDETDIGRVREGLAATVTLDAYPDIRVKAAVAHISHESKTISNVTMYEVELVPDRVPDVFRSGMSATVTIKRDVRDNVLLVNADAVRQDEKGSYVLLSKSKNSRPARQAVRTGDMDGNNMEITSGLKDGDLVVVDADFKVPEKSSGGRRGNLFKKKGR